MFSLPTLAMWGMALVIGFLAFKLYMRFDNAREDRRGAAYEAAVHMDSLGLTHTAEFYRAYAKGDYSGMGAKAYELGKLLSKGGAAVEVELAKVTERVLAAKLQSEAGRTHIAALLKQAEQPTDPAKGPEVAVKPAAK